MLKNDLKDAYDYIVVPKAVIDLPIESAKLLREDGTYYSLRELSDEMKDQFTLTPIIDDRFVMFRWVIFRNGEEAVISQYLKANGLMDMRDNGIADSLNYTVEEIDFNSLAGNEFGIFSLLEAKSLPKIKEVLD